MQKEKLPVWEKKKFPEPIKSQLGFSIVIQWILPALGTRALRAPVF